MSWLLAPYWYVSSQFLDAVRSALGCAGQVIMKKNIGHQAVISNFSSARNSELF
jgi:hypothetical protein